MAGHQDWLFGTKLTFAPLSGAHGHGDEVVVPYDAESSPRRQTPTTSTISAPTKSSPCTTTTTGSAELTRASRPTIVPRRGPQGDNTSGPQTDDAMTRSEEQLDVNKRTRQIGTARLRKWIETEDVEIRVPIRREKARMVTEPITDANRDRAMAGGDLTTEEHEVVLNEEVVDVNKRVVPKERVRLETETETDEVAVDDTVRKERIDFDHDTTDRRRRGR